MSTDFPADLSEEFAGHRDAIYRYIVRIVRDPAVAEDLTQDSLLRAHDRLKTLESPSRLVPWLYRIATNLTYDRFRQASYRNQPQSLEAADGSDRGLAEIVEESGPRLDKLMEQSEMSACVQKYMAGLPDSYRAVILLHDAEGLTNPEIAEMLGISLPTVKIRIHRAREKLRVALGQACSLSADERGVVVCEPKSTEDGQ
jgi:RNA polymerase sigma-70 factor (ECF subfamily)